MYMCTQQLSKKLSRLFTGTEGVTSGRKSPMRFEEGGGVAGVRIILRKLIFLPIHMGKVLCSVMHNSSYIYGKS